MWAHAYLRVCESHRKTCRSQLSFHVWVQGSNSGQASCRCLYLLCHLTVPRRYSPTNHERLLFKVNDHCPCLGFCSLRKPLLGMVTPCLTCPLFLLPLESSAPIAEFVLLPIVEGLDHPPCPAPRLFCGLALPPLTPSALTFRITSRLQMPTMCWPARAAAPTFWTRWSMHSSAGSFRSRSSESLSSTDMLSSANWELESRWLERTWQTTGKNGLGVRAF